MKVRSLVAAVALVLAAVVHAPVSAAGQEAAPRTQWGHPDLQGTYTSKTITPLQRPAELAGRELLTVEEVANLEQEVVDRNAELLARPARRTAVTESVDVGADGAPGFYNNFWLDRGTTSTGRTSIVVDPPDGRIPVLTREAQRDEDARLSARSTRGPADTWIDMDLNDRCMLWSVGPPMLPTGYNNNYLFLQTPDYVVIQVEMIHDTRIIPLDGRPRLGRPIPQWLGEMRGHWEGDTLVVETRTSPVARKARRSATTSFASAPPTAAAPRACAWWSASRGSTPTPSATSSRSRTRPAGRARGPASCPCGGPMIRSSSTPATRGTTASPTC